MINANSTVARLDGLAVVVLQWGEWLSVVRFIGPEGKAINRGEFFCETQFLTAF